MERHTKMLAVAMLATATILAAVLASACIQDSDGAIEEKHIVKVDGDTRAYITINNALAAYSSANVKEGTGKSTFTLKAGFLIDNSKWKGDYWAAYVVKSGTLWWDGVTDSWTLYSKMADNGSGSFPLTTFDAVAGDSFTITFRLCKSQDWDKKESDVPEASFSFSFYDSTQYTYTTSITYDINYGTNAPAATQDTRSSESVLGTIQMTVSDSTAMSREGYVFKGWSKSLDGSDLVQPGGAVTVNAGESSTLYAIWQEETVTITLMDGGSVYQKYVVTKGSVPSLPSLADRSEEVFMGWFNDSGLAEPWDTSSAATKDIVLYAGWQPELYFTTDPVADCKVTKTSYRTYIFDATVSEGFATSAKSVTWTVSKDGETIHESTGPYMTYQFLEDGEYDVAVKLVNSYGTESVHTEHVTIDTSEHPSLTTGMIVLMIMAVLFVVIVARARL